MNDGFINLLNCNSATPESSTVRYFVEYISRYDGKPYRLNAEGAGFTVGSKYPTAFPSITGALAALVKRTARRLESNDARIIRVETTPGKTTRRVLGEGDYVLSDDKYAIQFTGPASSFFGQQHATVDANGYMTWQGIDDATLFDTEGDALLAVNQNTFWKTRVGTYARIVRVAISTEPSTVKETVLA